MSLRERLGHSPPGYQYTIGRVLTIYAGLMVTLLLAALDQTIVATALPRIVSDIGGITQYSWVFTSYMLTSTVAVPVYGRLGDVHGRRPLMLIAVNQRMFVRKSGPITAYAKATQTSASNEKL